MMSPLHDSASCTGVLPWTYYVNDPSGLVLAVYHGRQMNRSQLGDGCPDPPTPPTEPTRRVFIYPVECRSYGPDGVNVVYERENTGANAGQWVRRYLTTDYQGTVLQAHDGNGDHVQHYELFDAEKGQVARRTGWLDREIDWESSPLTDLYRTVDLVNRKYDPQRGVFLTSDPLWMMSADASSYHYAYHDPMNMIDPWGLDPLSNPLIPNKANKNQQQPNVNPGAQGESGYGHSNTFDQPGSNFGGSGMGTGGGNGGIGQTDVAPSSSPTGTGNVIPSTESKLTKERGQTENLATTPPKAATTPPSTRVTAEYRCASSDCSVQHLWSPVTIGVTPDGGFIEPIGNSPNPFEVVLFAATTMATPQEYLFDGVSSVGKLSRGVRIYTRFLKGIGILGTMYTAYDVGVQSYQAHQLTGELSTQNQIDLLLATVGVLVIPFAATPAGAIIALAITGYFLYRDIDNLQGPGK